jgi:threonine synthase
VLGDRWQRLVDLSDQSRTPVLPEAGLIAAMEQMDAETKRVVVIEDTPEQARLMKLLLRNRYRCDVHIASNGREGMELVRLLKPDMVITDLMMPDVDGFMVIETLKNDPQTSHIPIIVVTAKELTVKDRARLDASVDMLLQKGSGIDDEFVESLVKKLKN